MKDDLANCPPWILARLRSEREMRRKLAEQTAEQTEILSAEVNEWRSKAFLYKSQKDELELQMVAKNEDLEKVKEMAKKIVAGLKEEVCKRDEELKKKGEILEMLKLRLQQYISSGGKDPTDLGGVLTSSAAASGGTSPRLTKTLGGSSPNLAVRSVRT